MRFANLSGFVWHWRFCDIWLTGLQRWSFQGCIWPQKHTESDCLLSDMAQQIHQTPEWNWMDTWKQVIHICLYTSCGFNSKDKKSDLIFHPWRALRIVRSGFHHGPVPCRRSGGNSFENASQIPRFCFFKTFLSERSPFGGRWGTSEAVFLRFCQARPFRGSAGLSRYHCEMVP